jgi:hypothetical protein
MFVSHLSQLSGEQGRNPLVLATFSGRDSDKPRKRVLFYGTSSMFCMGLG